MVSTYYLFTFCIHIFLFYPFLCYFLGHFYNLNFSFIFRFYIYILFLYSCYYFSLLYFFLWYVFKKVYFFYFFFLLIFLFNFGIFKIVRIRAGVVPCFAQMIVLLHPVQLFVAILRAKMIKNTQRQLKLNWKRAKMNLVLIATF